MNKAIIFIILLVMVPILLTKNKVSNTAASIIDQVIGRIKLGAKQLERATRAGQALKDAGATGPQLSYLIPQIAWETGHFKSAVMDTDNNYSGIKYVGQSGATPGSKAPGNEGKAPYAHFNSPQDWAKDHLRILKKVGKARPLEATSLQDYVSRLKKNGYFTDTEANYYKGLDSLQNMYKPLILALQN